jgi:Fe-S-cluster containining protein
MHTHCISLSLDDTFSFSCSPGVACFNQCCRDLNQSLYPYDIVRLSKRLGLSSSEFLRSYTSQHIGPESGLPIVTLKSADARRLTCPFVSEKGCSVYPDRPSSCRTYPLVRALSRSRETGKISEHFMLLKESHCLGFNAKTEHTVRQWIKDQEITIYNQINDKLMEIISLKSQWVPGPLDLELRHLAYMALYDLDNFKNQILKNTFADNLKVNPDRLNLAQTEDTALLEVGIEWVKELIVKSAQDRS